MIVVAADIIIHAPGLLNIASDTISALRVFILRLNDLTTTNPSFRHSGKHYDNMLSFFFNLRPSVCFIYTQAFYILLTEFTDVFLYGFQKRAVIIYLYDINLLRTKL